MKKKLVPAETNLTVFGEEAEIPIVVSSRKPKTMQEMFGLTEGKTCKTCAHCYGRQQSRTWYKCELWLALCFPGGGHSASSDIRLKNPACGKYEEEVGNAADISLCQ